MNAHKREKEEEKKGNEARVSCSRMQPQCDQAAIPKIRIHPCREGEKERERGREKREERRRESERKR